MNKASNKSQDPRMRDAGKSFRKWKKKSNRKDDKSMMQAEVKYYKDKDMTVQDQDGSSVTRNRLTIYQGIYGHGCASGAVCREIGFTKEGKARAEADLCRIIDLARNGSVINQSRRMSTTEVTPQRSFAVKDRVTQEEVGSKAVSISFSDKEEKVDDPEDSKSPQMTSQSPDHHSSSQSSNSKRPRNPPCEKNKEKQTNKRKNSGSKFGNPVNEKENRSQPVEDKVSTVEASAAEDKEIQCELLTEAIMESLDEAAKKIGRVRKLNVATVKKMHSIWRYALEEGKQRQPPGVISAAFSKLEQGCHMKGKVDQKPENKYKKGNETSLRTTSRDYLQAKHTSDTKGLPQASLIESKGHSVLDVTLHSEKTIISPMALLKQYENKLDLVNSDKLKDNVHISGTEEVSLKQGNVNEDKMECNSFAHTKEHKEVPGNLERISNITSYHAKGRGVETPKFHSAVSASCPKTVVVNPINFLQRYEQQSKEKKDHCVDTGNESPSSSVDYFMQVLSKDGQRQKLSLDSNVHMSRTEYWTSKSSNNDCYFLDTRRDKIGDGRINEGGTCKVREGCKCRKCMTNIGSKISDEQAYHESNNSAVVDRVCYSPDAPVQKMNIARSHSISNSSLPHFSLNSFSLSNPYDAHFNVISSDKHVCSSVLNKPIMYQQPKSQIQDLYQRHIPSTVSMAHSKLDHSFPTVHPPGDPTLRNMTKPKESVLSTMNENRQGSGRPPFLHSQSHTCCNNSEGTWPFQMDCQYGSNYSSRRQYVLEGAPYPLTGFNYDLKSNIYGDEPCSEGSSQNSSSQELIRLQNPHPHPTGRDIDTACVKDWVDHQDPQPNIHFNQITSQSEFSHHKLCVENNPSPEERFYRRKLY